MKILLTGMTAAHHSEKHSLRVPTYMSQIHTAVQARGCEVVWQAPDMRMDAAYVASFDRVVVGLASPMSLAANHTYPALSVMAHAWDAGNLVLVVDAPEPFKITAALRSIIADPDRLTKPLFSSRPGYADVLRFYDGSRLLLLIEKLLEEIWPTTLVPNLPWSAPDFLSKHIPNAAETQIALNLDAIVLQAAPYRAAVPRTWDGGSGFWVADEPSTTYVKRLEPLLRWEVEPWRAGRWASLSETTDRLKRACGVILATYRSGEPWWSPALSPALLAEAPLVTDWRLPAEHGMHQDWALLPAHVEDASPDLRAMISVNQRFSYLDSILPLDRAVSALNDALGIDT
jgi:hypothetical protein